MEKKLQTKIIKWLKEQGAYVIKTKPGPGTPVGCPDIIALFHGSYAALEVKAAENSINQPGQLETLRRLGEHNVNVYRVYPENWAAVQWQLRNYFF